MNELVYPRERQLGLITLVLGSLVWLALVIATFSMTSLFIALAGLAAGFLLYVFAQSALIAHIKGNGVELSETQFPDLYAQFTACCDKLEIKDRPKAYVLNGDGGLNAFATKFLGTQFVVLFSNVVDAMAKHTDGVRFYIGHELGHLRMKHLSTQFLRWPVLWLPLIGAAFSRARETTCDRHGLACSTSPEGAARSLAALSAGAERWQDLDVAAYRNQANHASGFWMSFHELAAAYPWLTKRVARVLDTKAEMPKRNVFAYFLAMFVPYAGRMGAGVGLLLMVYILGMTAAVAIPAYQGYKAKAELAAVVSASQPAREALVAFYRKNDGIPRTLQAAGIASTLPNGTTLSLNPKGMILIASTAHGDLVFTPSADDQGNINWTCSNGENMKAASLPPACRAAKD